MSKFDAENFYDYCVNLVKDNIASKVAALNTEKSDSITLIAPDSGNYLSDYNNIAVTPSFFIYSSIIGVNVLQSVGTKASLEITVMFYVAFIDHSESDSAIRKGLRYTRGLQEIFLDNFSKNSQISDFQIFQHAPQSAQFENTSKWYKIGGIEIKGVISS